MNKNPSSFYYGLIVSYAFFVIYFFVLFYNSIYVSYGNNIYKAMFIVFVAFGLIFRFFRISFPAAVMIILFDIIATYFFFLSIDNTNNSLFLLGTMPFVIDWRNRLLICNNKNISSKTTACKNTKTPLEQKKVEFEETPNISRIDRRASSFTLGVFTVYLFFGIYLLLTMFQRGWNPDYTNSIYQIIFVAFIVIGIVLRCLNNNMTVGIAIITVDIIAIFLFILGMGFDQKEFTLFAIIPFIPDWINRF